MIKDLIRYVLVSVKNRFTRSFLTVLSILIGIMAVYALISFGQGVSKYVNDVALESGADKLIAQPKGAGIRGTSDTYLSQDDLDFIAKINGVAETTGMIMGQAEIKTDLRKKGKWVFVMGLSTVPKEQRLIEEAFGGIGLLEGRELKKGDSNKAVVGYNFHIANKLFSKPLKLGDKIYINDNKFEIIGFYEEIGNPGDDSNIYLTQDKAGELFDSAEKYGFIYIRSARGVNPSKLADKITEKLRKEKDEKEGQETFFVQTYEQLLQTFGSIITILNGILVIIAAISVLVAAVNIMNTMYTAVLERTKEIGIMKAIGATNNYILMIFFIESGTLGIMGGIMGIIFGYGLAKLGGAIAAASGFALLKPYFPWWLTVGCLVFSFGIGAVSGFFPALNASKQKPVDALRYE